MNTKENGAYSNQKGKPKYGFRCVLLHVGLKANKKVRKNYYPLFTPCCVVKHRNKKDPSKKKKLSNFLAALHPHVATTCFTKNNIYD